MSGLEVFMLGLLFAFNFVGLAEDLQYVVMGKEKYFDYYREHFIAPYKTLPLHIIIIIIVLAYVINRVVK